jgi:hypothetical protein
MTILLDRERITQIQEGGFEQGQQIASGLDHDLNPDEYIALLDRVDSQMSDKSTFYLSAVYQGLNQALEEKFGNTE